MTTPVQYAYKAETESGSLVRGNLYAADEAEAYRALREMRLDPILIKPVRYSRLLGIFNSAYGRKLSTPAIIRVFKKLATLSRAKAPLLDCLRLCAVQEKDSRVKGFLTRIADQVQAGTAFSDAIELDTIKLPNLIKALVLAAEHTGDFGAGFTRIAVDFAAQNKARKEITGQMIYPLILVLFVIATMFFISFYVLPQFERIFETANTVPPLLTRAIFAVGGFMRDYIWLFPFIILAVALGGRFLARYMSTRIDRFLLNLPAAGSLLRHLYCERYCRSLGALLTGGTPLAEAFPIAEQAIASPTIRLACEKVAAQVKSGAHLFESAKKERLFPDEILGLLEIGEKTGNLGEMALTAADLCQDTIETALKRFTAFLGPVLTALAGGLVAIVIASIMTGILSLNETIY